MKTRTEMRSQLAKLREEVEELVKQFNGVNQEKKYDEADKLDAEIAEKIGEYTHIVRTLCFEKCKETEDPMLTAVKMLEFKTIGVRDFTVGEDSKIPVREVIEKERRIDLLKLDSFCGGIGHDKQWNHMVQKLNFLFTVKKCIDLGVDPKQVNDSYAMSEIAKQINLGKTPTSKTQILKTVNKVLAAMIGEGYKADSHDVNYLLDVYSKKSRKALTITTANHRFMRNYLAEICHRVVTGASYNVEYKKVKGADTTPAQTAFTAEEPAAEEIAA